MFGWIFSAAIIFSIILAVAALSGYISERAGIVNLAIEGFMTIGALIYTIMRGLFRPEGTMQIPALLITIIATSLFTIFHSFICIQLRANQVISGTAINILAAGITLFLLKTKVLGLDGSGSVSIANFDYLGFNSDKGSPFYWVNILNILTIAIIIIFWLVIRFTRFGNHVVASGENPNALAAQGISVTRIRYIALFISGALAGLAGALFIQYNGNFYGGVNGIGFIALAILICGQWKIPLIIIASIVFGVLKGVADRSDSLGTFMFENIELFRALPFVISLVALIFTSKYSKAPKAVGQPYEKSQR